MFLKTNRQIQQKLFYASVKEANLSTLSFRCNRNGRLVENRKTSAKIWLCLQNSFEATLDPGGLFKLKPSKNDQSIMVFSFNYERSSFLCFFSI